MAFSSSTICFFNRLISACASLDLRVYEYKKNRTHDERQEAVILELWIEDWHGRDLPYAECLTDNETASRVWFHRDNAGTPTGVTGPVPTNALL